MALDQCSEYVNVSLFFPLKKVFIKVAHVCCGNVDCLCIYSCKNSTEWVQIEAQDDVRYLFLIIIDNLLSLANTMLPNIMKYQKDLIIV